MTLGKPAEEELYSTGKSCTWAIYKNDIRWGWFNVFKYLLHNPIRAVRWPFPEYLCCCCLSLRLIMGNHCMQPVAVRSPEGSGGIPCVYQIVVWINDGYLSVDRYGGGGRGVSQRAKHGSTSGRDRKGTYSNGMGKKLSTKRRGTPFVDDKQQCFLMGSQQLGSAFIAHKLIAATVVSGYLPLHRTKAGRTDNDC